jgi:hypothetical protein
VSLYSSDHIKLLKALAENHVKYILVGGHAAIFYGVNRNTGDLDILIEPTSDNGQHLLTALSSMGLELPEIQPYEFEKELVLSFGLEPEAVDILTYTPGIQFSEAFNNAQIVELGEITTRIIDIQDLIKNKENLNRQGEKSLLDKYDVEVLKKILRKRKEK